MLFDSHQDSDSDLLSPTALNPVYTQLAINLCQIPAKWHRVPEKFKVLDPFCGAGSILNQLELFGGSCLDIYGMDCEERYLRYLKRRCPNLSATLLASDIRYCDFIRPNSWFELDAIICDPPYDIRAPSVDSEVILKALADFAKNHLRPGRRLAFWWPAVCLSDAIILEIFQQRGGLVFLCSAAESSPILSRKCWVFMKENSACMLPQSVHDVNLSWELYCDTMKIVNVETSLHGPGSLFEMARRGHIPSHLLDPVTIPNIRDPHGKSLLHYACAHGHSELVNTLLTLGCDPWLSFRGATPLHYIVRQSSPQHISAWTVYMNYLMEKFDVDTISDKIMGRTDKNESILSLPAQFGHVSMLSSVLDRLEYLPIKWFDELLHASIQASRFGQAKSLKLLLECSDRVLTVSPSSELLLLLTECMAQAGRWGHTAISDTIFQYILTMGMSEEDLRNWCRGIWTSKVNIGPALSTTCLHEAARFGRQEILENWHDVFQTYNLFDRNSLKNMLCDRPDWNGDSVLDATSHCRIRNFLSTWFENTE